MGATQPHGADCLGGMQAAGSGNLSRKSGDRRLRQSPGRAPGWVCLAISVRHCVWMAAGLTISVAPQSTVTVTLACACMQRWQTNSPANDRQQLTTCCRPLIIKKGVVLPNKVQIEVSRVGPKERQSYSKGTKQGHLRAAASCRGMRRAARRRKRRTAPTAPHSRPPPPPRRARRRCNPRAPV